MKTIVLSSATAQLIHLIFEWTAIAIGVQIYRWQRSRYGAGSMLQPGQYAVMLGCILGAAIGNKLVFWLEVPHLWNRFSFDFNILMSGQSIVGGLLGGLVGVELAKKFTGIRQSTGDNFVLPLIVGTIVGRVGCFLAGLHDGTYGNPTQLPWGVDFGDGLLRHPTQLYDMIFVLLYGSILLHFRNRWQSSPGLLFKLYLSGYLIWRLLVDGLKPVPYDYGFGLSGIQYVCLFALLLYIPLVIKQYLRLENHALPQA